MAVELAVGDREVLHARVDVQVDAPIRSMTDRAIARSSAGRTVRRPWAISDETAMFSATVEGREEREVLEDDLDPERRSPGAGRGARRSRRRRP